MLIAIQEYNNLCAQHGVDNMSIKAVAETYDNPTTMFWKRYILELSPPELLLPILCVVECFASFDSLNNFFHLDSIVIVVFFWVAESVVSLLA